MPRSHYNDGYRNHIAIGRNTGSHGSTDFITYISHFRARSKRLQVGLGTAVSPLLEEGPTGASAVTLMYLLWEGGSCRKNSSGLHSPSSGDFCFDVAAFIGAF